MRAMSQAARNSEPLTIAELDELDGVLRNKGIVLCNLIEHMKNTSIEHGAQQVVQFGKLLDSFVSTQDEYAAAVAFAIECYGTSLDNSLIDTLRKAIHEHRHAMNHLTAMWSGALCEVVSGYMTSTLSSTARNSKQPFAELIATRILFDLLPAEAKA